MRKTLATLALSVALACAPATNTTHIRGTGSPGPGIENGHNLWQLQIENNNWLNAKVYLIPAYSDTGPRVATVTGLSSAVKNLPLPLSQFRIRVQFLSSNAQWVSDIWSPGVPCLALTVKSYVASTYVIPC